MSYIGKDGYLYTGGFGWGGSSGSGTSFYKQTNAGTNIVDHEIYRDGSYGIIVNSTGQVKVGAANSSTSATWSTVSVGGSTTGSNNKAVAVSICYNSQFVLMADGNLYVADDGATSMTSLVFSAATSTSRGGIVDIAMGWSNYQYVLFGNGDLYGGTAGGTSMSRIATNVKMFDFDSYHNNPIYIYDGSMIKYASAAGANTHTWSNLLSSNRTDVVQIRGSSWNGTSQTAGWGFLTSSGTLYTIENSGTTKWTGSNHTRSVTGVSYFDNAGTYGGAWGYLKSGQIYLWTPNTSSYGSTVTTNTSPSTSGLTNNSGLPTPDLGESMPSINSSPPAKHLHFSKKKLIIN